MNFTCHRIMDYSQESSNRSAPWYSVNDNVMGGRSLGAIKQTEAALMFYGSINTNGGGFASIRQDLPPNALQNANQIRLSVKSDGRRYSLNIRDRQSASQRIAHQTNIPPTAANRFQTVEIVLADLAPTFRGRRVNAEPLSSADATSLGIILSDGVDGPFEFQLAWIDICKPIS